MTELSLWWASQKAAFWAWYTVKIQAGWYRSASLIGGWATSAIVFLPDLLQFVVDHFDFFGRFLLPKFDPETKAIILALYLTFGAPPLRAWLQKKMQKISIKQQAEAGKVIPLPASGVSSTVPSGMVAVDPVKVIIAAGATGPEVLAQLERSKSEPGPL